MFVLGHVGISMGIVLAFVLYYTKYIAKGITSNSLLDKIDFRIIAVSAMLPDIVDKIIGMWILGEEVSNGRIFTHSLITVTIFSLAFLNISKIKFSKITIPTLYVFPVFLHLVLDGLWELPGTLFWPLMGTRFPRVDVEFGDYFELLLSSPVAWMGELIGIMIIFVLFIRYRVYLRENLVLFLKKGRFKLI